MNDIVENIVVPVCEAMGARAYVAGDTVWLPLPEVAAGIQGGRITADASEGFIVTSVDIPRTAPMGRYAALETINSLHQALGPFVQMTLYADSVRVTAAVELFGVADPELARKQLALAVRECLHAGQAVHQRLNEPCDVPVSGMTDF